MSVHQQPQHKTAPGVFFIVKFILTCYRYLFFRFIIVLFYCFAFLQLILCERWDEMYKYIYIYLYGLYMYVVSLYMYSAFVFLSCSCLENFVPYHFEETPHVINITRPQNWLNFLSISSFQFSDLSLSRTHTRFYFVCSIPQHLIHSFIWDAMNLKAIVKCMIYGRNSNKTNHHQISRTPQRILTNTRTSIRTKTLLTHKWQSQSHYSELESIPYKRKHKHTQIVKCIEATPMRHVFKPQTYTNSYLYTFREREKEREGGGRELVSWVREGDRFHKHMHIAWRLRLSSKVCWGFKCGATWHCTVK